MQLVTVSKSYLTHTALNEYFSLNELDSILANDYLKQATNKLLGRIALKHSYASNHFNKIIIDYSNSGAPIIKLAPSVNCSISHSNDLSVAVSAVFKVGVDVEVIRPHDKSLLEFISNPEELKLFNISDVDTLVTYIWVIKEAISKALGVGIAYPFQEMIIRKEDDNFTVDAGGVKWSSKVLQYNNYVISICYPTDKKDESLKIKHIL